MLILKETVFRILSNISFKSCDDFLDSLTPIQFPPTILPLKHKCAYLS